MRTEFLTTETAYAASIIDAYAMAGHAHSLGRAMADAVAAALTILVDFRLSRDGIFQQVLQRRRQAEIDIGGLCRTKTFGLQFRERRTVEAEFA